MISAWGGLIEGPGRQARECVCKQEGFPSEHHQARFLAVCNQGRHVEPSQSQFALGVTMWHFKRALC